MMRSVVLAALILVAPTSLRADEWTRFEGAWFAAEAPAAFAAQVLANAVADDGPMTVRFLAPDGEAAFFIHAPLWSAPTPAIEGLEGEVLLDERTAATGDTLTTWLTWRDEETAKQRSYRIVRGKDGATLTVYGFEYASTEALARWRPAYQRFLASVERFAD